MVSPIKKAIMGSAMELKGMAMTYLKRDNRNSNNIDSDNNQIR